MNIRVAKIDDSPAIAEVHVRTWRSAYKNILPDELLNNLSIEKRTEAWKNGFEAADNGTAIVAELPDAGIVGWAHFSKSRDDDNGRCSVGEITGIYILSEYWRQGIGRGLFSYALAELRKHFSDVTIWVLRENHGAIAFYERMGFFADGGTKVEERPNVVFDCVRYRKDIKG
jgi:GNAT superfamily N-acetyltransferase